MYFTEMCCLFIEYRDYNASPMEITILSDQPSSGCFNVTIINDDTYELKENFVITINSTDKNVSVTEGATQITIVDEDSKLQSLSIKAE